MTNPRVLVAHRRPRFRLVDGRWEVLNPKANDAAAREFEIQPDGWVRIETAAAIPPLSEAQRAEGTEIARLYLIDAEDHRQGLPVDKFLRLGSRELRGLGFAEDSAGAALEACALSRPPAESFALLVNGLGALYEQVTGKRRTVRNDHDETSGAKHHTPFVRFAHAFWIELPICSATKRTRSTSQMAARINGLFGARGRYPRWDHEV